jgi:allophanate hydrolase subunit 1
MRAGREKWASEAGQPKEIRMHAGSTAGKTQPETRTLAEAIRAALNITDPATASRSLLVVLDDLQRANGILRAALPQAEAHDALVEAADEASTRLNAIAYSPAERAEADNLHAALRQVRGQS